MSQFMGYEMGGLATSDGDLFGYEVVDRATADEQMSGDDAALLHGPGGACDFINGRIRAAAEGETYSLRTEDDYIVRNGRWHPTTN